MKGEGGPCLAPVAGAEHMLRAGASYGPLPFGTTQTTISFVRRPL